MCKSNLTVSVSHSMASSLLLSREMKISVKEVLNLIIHDYGIVIFSMQAYTGIMKESNLYSK